MSQGLCSGNRLCSSRENNFANLLYCGSNWSLTDLPCLSVHNVRQTHRLHTKCNPQLGRWLQHHPNLTARILSERPHSRPGSPSLQRLLLLRVSPNHLELLASQRSLPLTDQHLDES